MFDERLFIFESDTLRAMRVDALAVVGQPVNGPECHAIAMSVVAMIETELHARNQPIN